MAASDAPPLRRGLAAMAVACAAALFITSFLPTPWLWGLNAAAFLAPGARGVVYALLLLALALILPGARTAPGTRSARTARPPRAAPSRRGVASVGSRGPALFIAVALALLFWLLRDRAHLLGDGLIYLDNILRGAHRLYSEPLSASAWYGYGSLLGALGVPPSEASLSTLPMLLGILAAALCWGIAGQLFPRRAERIVAAGLLFLMGMAQLWFGYVECYPVAAAAVLLYLYLLLRSAGGDASPTAAGLALAVAVAAHLAALFLLPSYVALLARRRPAPPGLLLAALAPPLAAALLLAGLGFHVRSVLEPLRLVRGAAGLGGASGVERIPSIVTHRIPDLLNLLLLLAPAALALWAGSTSARFRNAADRESPDRLLAWAAVPGALLVLGLALVVSPTQDWDLMAVPLLPAAALLAAIGARALRGASGRVRTGWLALALAPTLAFVLANADPTAAARRYAMLLSPSVLLSPHERAYGNEKLARFHRNRGEIERELRYDRLALAAEPGNARYWGAVGFALARLARTEEALPFLREATRREPRNTEGAYFFGARLLDAGRYREAADVLERVVAATGPRPGPRQALAAAYAALGDTARAQRMVDSLGVGP